MSKDKTPYTIGNVGPESRCYPRHVSDRVDELLEELDSKQVLQLYHALNTKTLTEWIGWIEEWMATILQYDGLSQVDRKRLREVSSSSDVLLCHHACVFLELWRVRTENQYFPLPPHGNPLDSPALHREMMLSVVVSFYDFDLRDLWPFDHADIRVETPFREDS